MRQGFTLVELSIVLVIIGLLIGGILVAQSMIETARIQAFIRQIQQFDAAVSDFKTKYNGLPGDSSIFGCIRSQCDDGLIEPYFINSGRFGFNTNYEVDNFWPNLSQDGFSPDTPYTSVTANIIAGTNVPLSQIGSKAGIVVTNAVVPGTQGTQNYYYLAVYINQFIMFSPATNGPSPAITAPQALAIDQKIDDGIPNTGTVQPYNSGAPCFSGSAYTISSGSQIVCFLRLDLLAQVGQSK